MKFSRFSFFKVFEYSFKVRDINTTFAKKKKSYMFLCKDYVYSIFEKYIYLPFI